MSVCSNCKQTFEDMEGIITQLEDKLFKRDIEIRKLNSEIKSLQEMNTLNAKVSSKMIFSKNWNNTSSNFSLPSEFKNLWDKMVKEQIIDAFPDFLEDHETLVGLT